MRGVAEAGRDLWQLGLAELMPTTAHSVQRRISLYSTSALLPLYKQVRRGVPCAVVRCGGGCHSACTH
jgi:hypothetical protein